MKKHTETGEKEEPIKPTLGIPKNLSLEKMMILRSQGLSYEQIAKVVDCDKSNVHNRLQNFAEFQDFKADIDNWYEALQFRVFKKISDEKLEKLNAYQLALVLSILEDKKRLVRGQATQKIDINNVHRSIQDIQSKERILEARYKLLTGKELGAAT